MARNLDVVFHDTDQLTISTPTVKFVKNVIIAGHGS